MIEAGERILPSIDETLASKAAKRLAQIGVEVLTEAKVEQVDAQGVVVSGQRIESAKDCDLIGGRYIPHERGVREGP